MVETTSKEVPKAILQIRKVRILQKDPRRRRGKRRERIAEKRMMYLRPLGLHLME